MSQAELDKEIAEIREEFNVLVMLLEENQRQGQFLKKKPVKWPKLQRRLQKREVKGLMENFREAEEKMEDSICRLEQGEILGEEDNERSTEDRMNYWIVQNNQKI